MRRTIAIAIVAFVVGVIIGNANAIQNAQASSGAHPPAASCAMYDPALNIGAWYFEGGNTNTAIFFDRGPDAYWVRDQVRVRFYAVPRRVTNLVENWPRIGSSLRVACLDKAWVRAVKKGMVVCGRMIEKGDAYTTEMYDVCIADYADMRMSKGA